jgi:hypothetical protein
VTRREEPAAPTGRGPAAVTADGCPVEVYAALHPAGEADLIHRAVAPGASVGVDGSASMLAHLRLAVPVRPEVLDDDALDAVLRSVGLHLDRTLTPDGAWVSAAR